MSILRGRLAAVEGAYCANQSKTAIARLREKLSSPSPSPSPPQPGIGNADVLPEILMHTLASENAPAAAVQPFAPHPSSLASSLNSSASGRHPLSLLYRPSSLHHMGPLAHFTGMPQTSLGRNRWNLELPEASISASTANEGRLDYGLTITDSAKLKDLAKGYFTIVKAFAVATGIVLGGGSIVIATVCSKLEIHSLEDIRVRGHQHMQRQATDIKQHLDPWKQWAQCVGERWRGKEAEYQAVGAVFKKSLGVNDNRKINEKNG